MEERMRQLEERVDALYGHFSNLAEAMRLIVGKVNALPTGQPKNRQRKATTYTMYLEVKSRADAGMDYKDIAVELGIPASTCAGYLDESRWTPEYIEKKKLINP